MGIGAETKSGDGIKIMGEKAIDESLRIPDLSIKGFRGFQDLHIPKLGRVTLITGKNNVGKSSLLEALRLYAANAAPDVLDEILASREENAWGEDAWGFTNPSPLFHRFSPNGDESERFSIATHGGGDGPASLTARLEWRIETRDGAGNAKLALPDAVSEEYWSDPIPVLAIATEDGKRIRRLDGRPRISPTRPRPKTAPPIRERFPCALIDAYAINGTADWDELWSEIALTDSEREVVEALRIISPEITAVSMVKGESNERIAIARVDGRKHPVPLRSFGDGVNRLFAMILSLVNAQGGLLLIDEFENGLHHSVQTDVWRAIFKLARKLDVQVFAATHSQDAVKAFQKAASESPGEDLLVRLVSRYERIFATMLSEKELEIANRHNMRVRG